MFELYSRRNRNVEDDLDVFEYNFIDEKTRTQLFYLAKNTIDDSPSPAHVVSRLRSFLLMELGKIRLSAKKSNSEYDDLRYYWYECGSEEFLDMLDATIHFIGSKILYNIVKFSGLTNQINYRLKQNNLGYEVVEDKIIRIDNELVHSKVIKPTLLFLHDKNFMGAEDEIFEAFDFLKNNDFKNTIFHAAKAFESTMKTICELQDFPYKPDKDTAKDLINILISNGYIPMYMSTHLHAVKNTLESGLPTLRNKEAGHGQGDKVKDVSESYAKYALNLTCTNILFLADLSNDR